MKINAKKDFYMSVDKRVVFMAWPDEERLPKGAAYIGENIFLGVDAIRMLYPGIKINQELIDSVLKGHHMSKLYADRSLAWSMEGGKWVG